MVEFVVVAIVSGLVSLAIKELYTVCMLEVVKLLKVDQSLVDLCSSYKKIGDILLGGLDCWIIPAGSLESHCWHELVICWYETEDLIDHFISQSNPLSKKTWGEWGHNSKIKNLQKKLDKLGEQFQNLLPKEATQRQSLSVPPGYRGSLLDRAPFVGGTARDDDKQTIIRELITHKIGVSIVGVDGLGKTSLARIVAEDASVRRHFPVILNVSVSRDYFVTEDVVEKLSRKEAGNTLILLDDLSNVTDGEWERFRCKYLDSNTRILTTTRNPKVAEVTGSFAYYLDQLKDEDCAKIIKEKSNVSRFNSTVWDKDIEEIAKKCKGMPLIASKFGLTLLRKASEDAFQSSIENLRDTGLWDLVEFKEIFPSFKLNDPQLPPHLIRCFAYCSLFSPKHGFKRSELVQLWKVEGLQPSGSQCFDALLQRSIFHPLELCDDTEQSYRMQDLNYYFAQLLASTVFFRIDEGNTNSSSPSPSKHTRHMSLASENVNYDQLIKQMKGHEALRTILMIHQGTPIPRDIDPTFFDKLQGVRVLDLSFTNLTKVVCSGPSSIQATINPNAPQQSGSGQSINISAFKHLRYLDLSGNKFKELPKEIDRFCSLQVLKIMNCKHLEKLPKTLSKLSSLTHLEVEMMSLKEPPPELGKLTKLEVLISYKVRDQNGTRVSELGTMKHLIELRIIDLNEISNQEEAKKSKLVEKKKLKRLTLEWLDADDQASDVEQEVLKGLEPSADLKHLTLRRYNGTSFPKWFSHESKKLVSIRLQDCKYCDVLPALRQLPLLRTLALNNFDSLEDVNNQFCATKDGGFPCLEKLEFKCMNKLVSWVQLDARSMPRLQSLVIENCLTLESLPSLKHHVSLVILDIKEAPELKALPELPSSMNRDNVKLILQNCSVLKERCQKDNADWEKIKNIKNKSNIFDHFKPPPSRHDKVCDEII